MELFGKVETGDFVSFFYLLPKFRTAEAELKHVVRVISDAQQVRWGIVSLRLLSPKGYVMVVGKNQKGMNKFMRFFRSQTRISLDLENLEEKYNKHYLKETVEIL